MAFVEVYWKVNRDTQFRADDLDIAGGWMCSDAGEVTFPFGTAEEAIAQNLYEVGFFTVGIPQRAGPSTETGRFHILSFWTARPETRRA